MSLYAHKPRNRLEAEIEEYRQAGGMVDWIFGVGLLRHASPEQYRTCLKLPPESRPIFLADLLF